MPGAAEGTGAPTIPRATTVGPSFMVTSDILDKLGLRRVEPPTGAPAGDRRCTSFIVDTGPVTAANKGDSRDMPANFIVSPMGTRDAPGPVAGDTVDAFKVVYFTFVRGASGIVGLWGSAGWSCRARGFLSVCLFAVCWGVQRCLPRFILLYP